MPNMTNVVGARFMVTGYPHVAGTIEEMVYSLNVPSVRVRWDEPNTFAGYVPLADLTIFERTPARELDTPEIVL